MSKLKTTLFLGIFSLLLIPGLARAADCQENSILNFISRDPGGDYITNARVEIYKQEPDANGQPKPTTRFASVTTNANLGIAKLSWRNPLSADTYAVKVQTINKDAASFWYYDISIACGETINLEKTLSGLDITLHDADGNLLRNTNFNIYSQLYSDSGQPLSEKKELVASLNSGSSANLKVYLPQGSVANMGRTLSDHYALELNRGNIKFITYSFAVHDGQMTTVDFYTSAIYVRIKDAAGAIFPVSTKVEVFKQVVDQNNDRAKGDKVGEFSIGDNGYGRIELIPGIYVLAVKGQNNQYLYFWDLESKLGRTTEYDLTSSQTWVPATGSCQNNSNLYLTLTNAVGEVAPGLRFEIYEQELDSSGLPVAGSKISSGTVNNSGQATIAFKPDPRKGYALKVWDKNASAGDYWFFDALKFVCGYNRVLSKALPVLKIVLRDGQGNLKKDYNFSLYAQREDADGQPIYQSSDLIANFKTGSGGYALAYLAPYNPYRRNQTGLYVLAAKDENGNAVAAYNLRPQAEKNETFTYTFSSLSGELRDSRQKLLADKEIRIYEQLGSGSDRRLGKLLKKIKTSSAGKFQAEYPLGIYALATLDNFNQENIFWDIRAKVGGSATKLVNNLTNFTIAESQGEGIAKDTAIKLYLLNGSNSNGYYRDKEIGSLKLGTGRSAVASVATGPYLAVYVSKSNKEYGQPFYANNGLFQKVNIAVNQKGLISADQAFKVNIPAAPSTTSNSNTAASTGLKGRILLQVEDKGQAWYVNPGDGKRYFLGRPADAFKLMRRFGLGISNADFATLESNPGAWMRLAGRILIKVEDDGRAYYFDGVNRSLHYLGRPSDAFNVIRNLGLGISNQDLNKISAGD